MKNFLRGNPVSCRTNRLLISYEISKQARVAAFLRAFLFVSFFFPVCAPKEESWSKAFLAETVETGDKYRDTTYNIFIRCRVFSERVGPRILSLESVDYFGTSEYFSGRKKKNLYEQTSAKLCRWWGKLVGCGKLSLYANESCDKHAVLFRRWWKWRAIFITFLLFGNDLISLESRPLIFVYLYTRSQIVKYDVKSKYPEEHSTVDKVGREKLIARKSCFV